VSVTHTQKHRTHTETSLNLLVAKNIISDCPNFLGRVKIGRNSVWLPMAKNAVPPAAIEGKKHS
jgi:hypothetical protein